MIDFTAKITKKRVPLRQSLPSGTTLVCRYTFWGDPLSLDSIYRLCILEYPQLPSLLHPFTSYLPPSPLYILQHPSPFPLHLLFPPTYLKNESVHLKLKSHISKKTWHLMSLFIFLISCHSQHHLNQLELLIPKGTTLAVRLSWLSYHA